MRPSSTLGKHIVQVDPLPKGLACMSCKQRKVRCDGVSPACAACLRTAKFEGRDPSTVCCIYQGPKASIRRKKPSPRSVRASSAGSTSSDRAEALLSEMDRQIQSGYASSGSDSHASSPGSHASTSSYPIASTSASSIGPESNYLVATTSYDFNAPTSYLLPPPALPYAAAAWSDSTSTLVDPLALPPVAPAPAPAPVQAAAPVPLPLESTDSYFPYFAYANGPGSPGSLHSAWSSDSSHSSSDSLESLHSPPDQPLFGGEFSLAPDAYDSFNSGAADLNSSAYYGLPPAPITGDVNFAGLGLGYTPGGKVQAEQPQAWIGATPTWLGVQPNALLEPLWNAAI